MPSPLSNTTKVYQVIFGGALVGLGYMVTKGMMRGRGGITNFKMIAAIFVAVAIVLALDKNYWMLYPLLTSFGLRIPGIPARANELACIAVTAMWVVRSTLRSGETSFKWKPGLLASLPVFTWIFIVFIQKPPGIAKLGSTYVGGRFYIDQLVAFVAMLALSSFRFREKECKKIFLLILSASVVNLVFTLLHIGAGGGDEEEVVASQHYELLGALTVYILLICRYELHQFLTSGWKFLTAVLLAGLVLYTGKRQGVARLALAPIFRVALTGRDKGVLGVAAVIGAFMLALLVIGDGTFYRLPRSVRRGLSIVVPKYETSNAMGTRDLFREEIHRRAKLIMRENPWFGRKGYAMDLREAAWIAATKKRGTNFELHTYSGNWHSTWWAFVADFGVPAAVFWFFFIGFSAVIAVKLAKRTGTISGIPYLQACVLYYAADLLTQLLFSLQSGHSALVPLGACPMIGLLHSISNGFEDELAARRNQLM